MGNDSLTDQNCNYSMAESGGKHLSYVYVWNAVSQNSLLSIFMQRQKIIRIILITCSFFFYCFTRHFKQRMQSMFVCFLFFIDFVEFFQLSKYSHTSHTSSSWPTFHTEITRKYGVYTLTKPPKL